MEKQFVNIEYTLLAPDVLVPLAWPIWGLECFVLAAVRKIAEISRQESPVIQVNKIFARLVRNHPLGFPIACELVPKGEVTGVDVYEIASHLDDNNNVLEIGSGSGSGSLQEALSAHIKGPLCVLRPRQITMFLKVQKYKFCEQKGDQWIVSIDNIQEFLKCTRVPLSVIVKIIRLLDNYFG